VLAAASYDGRVRRWNASGDDFPELASCGGHNGWCTSLAFHQDGDWLYSADSWGQIQAWNTVEGLDGAASADPKPRWRVAEAHNGWARDLAVSPNGQTLASCGMDQRVRLWSATDGAPRGELAAYGADIFCIRYSPDGQTLFTGDDRGWVKQWKLDGSLVREFDAQELHTLSRLQDVGGVRSLALNSDASLLAVGGTIPKNGGTVVGDPTIFLFDVATGERKGQYKLGDTHDVAVVDLHFHDAGFMIAVTCGTPGKGKLVYFHPDDKEPFFEAKKVNCQSVALRPDGKQLAVVATNAGSNGNGRRLDKDGKYPGNQSPIHLFNLP
jgi:WD40 repeat protein